jgi:hypothetical protein
LLTVENNNCQFLKKALSIFENLKFSAFEQFFNNKKMRKKTQRRHLNEMKNKIENLSLTCFASPKYNNNIIVLKKRGSRGGRGRRQLKGGGEGRAGRGGHDTQNDDTQQKVDTQHLNILCHHAECH